MSTLKQQVITIARTYLRDFPQFLQLTFDPAGRTYELGSPNIDTTALWVAYVPNSASAGSPSASVSVVQISPSDYDVDARNSLLRLRAPLVNAYKILVEGYHYDWISPDDLSFFADRAINDDTFNLNVSSNNLAGAVIDTIGIHALVDALWALLTEAARDIDVITSESVHIQASQRYRMLQGLVDHWSKAYEDRAASLNIGLQKIEQFTLRRRSLATGRLVPIYLEREYGDIGPITRIWPDIPTGTLDLSAPVDNLRQNVYIEGDPPPAYGYSSGYGPW